MVSLQGQEVKQVYCENALEFIQDFAFRFLGKKKGGKPFNCFPLEKTYFYHLHTIKGERMGVLWKKGLL